MSTLTTRYAVVFLSIQAQDFIEDHGHSAPAPITAFLSIQAQDFIEESCLIASMSASSSYS